LARADRAMRSSASGYLIERVEKGDVDAALELMGASDWGSALELFRTASEVRDRALGRRVRFIGHVADVSPCSVTPPCRYCSLSSTIREYRAQRSPPALREVIEYSRHLVDAGVPAILYGGGISPASGTIATSIARSVREFSDVELLFNVGPIGEDHVDELGRLGVRRFVISLETMDRALFGDARPGDDLGRKLEFVDLLAGKGMGVEPILMNGVGAPSDLVMSIAALGGVRNLVGLRFSTFSPVPGTPWEGRPPASALTTLKACAIARIMYPGIRIDLAAGTPDGVKPLSLLAGCGDEMVGVIVGRRGFRDSIGELSRYAREMGFSVDAPRAS